MEKQASLLMSRGGLDLSHGLSIQPTAVAVVAARSNVFIQCAILCGYCVLNFSVGGLLRASADFGERPLREVSTVCAQASASLHTQDIPYAVPLIWDLLLAIQ